MSALPDRPSQLVRRGRAARLVTGSLGPGLGDEQVDLVQFLVEGEEVVGEPRRQRVDACGRLGRGVVRHQSSGIRIQPWRIAYTTAWVRSLTDSLRRIELMWFLTVCSLIVSA